MSLFKWFYGKTAPASSTTDLAKAALPREAAPVQPAPARPMADTLERSEERKLKRHARREQLYLAVRDAMTYSGVLSASYKFKVLSLDQVGDQFLVMMDIDQTVDAGSSNLHAVEAKIIQSAKARFEIAVNAVYWRVNAQVALRHPKPAPSADAAQALPPLDSKTRQPMPSQAAAAPQPAATPPRKPLAPRYEPIQDDEVAAFKQALAAASASSAAAAGRAGAKNKLGPRSYTLITGFEDTEMPDANSAPALSNTQYGDLN